MKSYYLRNVLNQIINKKVETMIIFSILLIMSLFLSLIHFFGYDDSMEANIANTLSLRYEIGNTHVVGPEGSEITLYDYHHDYFERIITWIEEVEKEEEIDYADYNIQMDLYSGYDKEMGFLTGYRLFGVSNENYLLDNHIELVEGRFLSQEEIDSGVPYIIVSNETSLKIGDHISLGEADDKNGGIHKDITVEVIGIYKHKKQSIYYEKNDSFVNSQGVLLSNKILHDLLLTKAQNETIDNYHYSLNHICFYLKDYQDYVGFQDKLDSLIRKFNREIENLEYIPSNLTITETNTGSIIQSVMRIKNVYQVIFSIVFIITALILISSIYYLLKKKSAEMSVYYSLGQSKLKITLHYALAYMLIGVVAVLIGITIGYLISNQLSIMMLKDNVELQSELLKFTSTTLDSSNINDNIQTLSFNGAKALYVAIETLAVVFISVLGSMMLILNDRILSRNGGWN